MTAAWESSCIRLHISNQNSANDFLVSHEHTLVVAETPIVPLFTGNETETVVSSAALVDSGQLLQ